MPVSFKVADHPANPVVLGEAETNGLTPELLLARACARQYENAGDILRSSFTDEPPADPKPSLTRRLSKLNPFSKSKPAPAATPPASAATSTVPAPVLIPTPNGFVHTIISAYNKHHNLIIRPDDVWITILTQFNFYVNANAELLRASFVAHEGKQELKVRTQASRHTMDFGAMSRQMVGLLAKVIIDPTLREWVMPDFSTTTLNDKTVGALVMMSTLKAYFEYTFEQCECGIPRVTLDGSKKDWQAILGRLEKLKEYGLQTTAWYHLLVPVIKRFVAAFDSPDSAANVDFWQKVAHREALGSGGGASYYCGWISAFCAFDDEGTWIGVPLNESPSQSSVAPEVLSAKEFWAHYAKPGVLNHNGYIKLCLDDTPFHRIESINIPSGYVEVPVKLKAEGTDVSDPCTMIAGVVGTLASVSEDTGVSQQNNIRDTVQPVIGWWMFLDK